MAQILDLKMIQHRMSHEIVIHEDKTKRVKFTFHIWLNEYRVYRNDEIIDSGQAIEELMNEYNDMF